MRTMTEKLSTFGCSSQASIAVIDNQPKKSRHELNPPPPIEQLQIQKKTSFGIQKVFIRGFKSLSNLFQFYREDDDSDNDEDIEMVIGLPTDVQHVAHIGWDGFNSGKTNMIKSSSNSTSFWDEGGGGSELLSLPSISLKQFELAMASQANTGPQ